VPIVRRGYAAGWVFACRIKTRASEFLAVRPESSTGRYHLFWQKDSLPNRTQGHADPMKILRTLLCIFVLYAVSVAEQGSSLRPVANMTAKEIVARMAENNRKRRQELQSYTGQRQYHLLYTGFPGRREADLVVTVKYEAPDNKEFTVISQSGSRFMINHV